MVSAWALLAFLLIVGVGTPTCRSGNPAVNRALHRFLLSSARLGDLPGIRAALQNGAPVDQGDGWDRTALMYAAAAGHIGAVKYLHGNGADLNRRSGSLGTTALMSAASGGHFHVVEYLLRGGAAADVVETEGRTALMYAVARDDPEIIALFLEHKADLEHQDRLGYTALTLAVILGHKQVVEYLIRKGADVNNGDREGRSPLDHALEREFAGIAAALRDAGGRRTWTMRRRKVPGPAEKN